MILFTWQQAHAQEISQKVIDYCKTFKVYTSDFWGGPVVYSFYKYDINGKITDITEARRSTAFEAYCVFYVNNLDQVIGYDNSFSCSLDTCVPGSYPHYSERYTYNPDGSLSTELFIKKTSQSLDSSRSYYIYKDNKFVRKETQTYNHTYPDMSKYMYEYSCHAADARKRHISESISKRMIDSCVQIEGKTGIPVFISKYDNLGRLVADTCVPYPNTQAFYQYADFKINYKDQLTSYVNAVSCSVDTCVTFPIHIELYGYNANGTLAWLKRMNGERPGGMCRDSASVTYLFKMFRMSDSTEIYYTYYKNRLSKREEDTYTFSVDPPLYQKKCMVTKALYEYIYNSDGTRKEKLVKKNDAVNVK